MERIKELELIAIGAELVSVYKRIAINPERTASEHALLRAIMAMLRNAGAEVPFAPVPRQWVTDLPEEMRARGERADLNL